MIHFLYPGRLFLLCGLQRKCIPRSKLDTDDLSENVTVEASNEKFQKPFDLIYTRTKSRLMFSQSLIPDESCEEFRKNYLQFYEVSVPYLQAKLPLDVNLIKYAQFVHSEKIKDADATNTISNLVLQITSVLSNVLEVVFQIRSKEDVVSE